MGERAYAGVAVSERRARRRERLIDAGLELFGTRGYAETTVGEVCRLARLSQRYFYEHFADRGMLFAAVYEHVVEVVMAATIEAMEAGAPDLEAQTQAGLDGFLGALERDPRLARVQLIEAVGRSEAMERRRREVLHAYAAVIAARSAALVERSDVTEWERHLAALALVGATNEVAIDWALGTLDAPRSSLVAQLARIYLAVAGAPAIKADGPGQP